MMRYCNVAYVDSDPRSQSYRRFDDRGIAGKHILRTEMMEERMMDAETVGPSFLSLI